MERRLCLIYAAILAAVAAINYIPGLTDESGLAFGIFALDPFDDALHLVSALWALGAGLRSRRAGQVFLLIFGAAYLGDGACGIATGWGYLDFAIFTQPSAGFSQSPLRIAANLPPIGLGAVALGAGILSVRRG